MPTRRIVLTGLSALAAGTLLGLSDAYGAGPIAAFLGTYAYDGGDKERKARDKAIDAACSELSPLIRGIAREQLLAANAIASSIAFSADKKNVTVSADARNYRAPLDGSKVRVRVPTGDEMDLRYAVKTGRVDQLFEGDDRGRTNRYTLGDDDVLVMGVRVFASQLPKDVLYKLTYRRAS